MLYFRDNFSVSSTVVLKNHCRTFCSIYVSNNSEGYQVWSRHNLLEMNTVTRILSEPQMRRPSPEMMTVIHPRSTSRSMSLIVTTLACLSYKTSAVDSVLNVLMYGDVEYIKRDVSRASDDCWWPALCKPVSFIDPYLYSNRACYVRYGWVNPSIIWNYQLYRIRHLVKPWHTDAIRSIHSIATLQSHMLGTRVNRDVNRRDVNRGDVNMYMPIRWYDFPYPSGNKSNLFHPSYQPTRDYSRILLL